MKLGLFRRENSSAARRERQAAFEKVVAEGLRTLSQVLSRLADLVEKQRLQRAGFEKPDTFLRRQSTSDREQGPRH